MENGYKLIALDMDGTVLNSQKQISVRTEKALKDAVAAGKKVIFSTGRPIIGLKKYKYCISEDLPMITFNGAVLIKLHSGEVISKICMDYEAAKAVWNLGKANKRSMLIWTPNRLFLSGLDYYTEKYLKMYEFDYTVIESADVLMGQEIIKVLWLGDPDEMRNCVSEIKEPLKDLPIHFYTSSPQLLEFVPENASKANAIKLLEKYFGIKREETIAVGDGYNDLDMIEYAGLGVAMENAPEDIKEKADIVTFDNDSDGVAQVIEKYML